MLRTFVVLATLLVLACAACSQNGADPAAPDSPSATTSTPTVPTFSAPPELAGYTAPERHAYAAAVSAYSAFVRRSNHFYAGGQTSVAAKNFYQRYSIDWATAWGNLAQAANNHIRVSGSTRVVWTKPVTIEVGSAHETVTMQRCLDESKWVVEQNGKRLAQPQLKTPHVYTVQLERRRGETWWRSGEPKLGATC